MNEATKAFELEPCRQTLEQALEQQQRLNALLLTKRNWLAKLESRSAYLPSAVFLLQQTNPNEYKTRFNVVKETRPVGLLESVMQLLGVSEAPASLVDALPKFAEHGDTEMEEMLNASRALKANTLTWKSESFPNGAVPIKGKLVVKKGGAYWEVLNRAFPLTIDMVAYAASLFTRLVPGGFLGEQTVRFITPKTAKGIPTQQDGSGFYGVIKEDGHFVPRSSAVRAFITRHMNWEPGKPLPALQFRSINPDNGLFAKGMVFPAPVHYHEVEADFILDHAQVKGARKGQTKDGKLYKQYFGILRTFDKPGTIAGNFEWVQWVKRNAETEAAVNHFQRKAFRKLVAGGLDGFIERACKSDELLEHLRQIYDAAGLPPITCPQIKSAVEAALQKSLFQIAQGCWQDARSTVVKMNAGLKKGHCVMGSYRHDKEFVLRYPLISPEALLKLLAHKVEGEMAPLVSKNQLTMSIEDCAAIQADDDGDTNSACDQAEEGDAEALEVLFDLANRIGYGRYRPEPKRTKSKNRSEESLQELTQPRMGAVGVFTVWQAELLAAGYVAEAIALMWPLQESIDCAKGDVVWTCVKKLTRQIRKYLQSGKTDEVFKPWGNIAYQRKNAEGEWYTPEGIEQPMQNYGRWVRELLKEKGFESGTTPLTWRDGTKRIDPKKWKTATSINGCTTLVHFAWNNAKRLWEEEFATQLSLKAAEIDIAEMLKLRIIDAVAPEMDLSADKTDLFIAYGVNAYRKAVAKSYRSRNDSEESQSFQGNSRLEANEKFEAAVQKRLEGITAGHAVKDIYNMFALAQKEADADKKSALTALVIRIAAHRLSPVRSIFGKETVTCPFWTKAVQEKIEALALDKTPEQWVEILATGEQHIAATGVSALECECCSQGTMDIIVRAHRDRHNGRHGEYAAECRGGLIKHLHKPQQA
jgi:hypothetical protein